MGRDLPRDTVDCVFVNAGFDMLTGDYVQPEATISLLA
jgi:hypothetical protein